MTGLASDEPPHAGGPAISRAAPNSFRLEPLEPRILLSVDALSEAVGNTLPDEQFQNAAPVVLNIEPDSPADEDRTSILNFDRQALQPLVNEALARISILDLDPQLLQNARDGYSRKYRYGKLRSYS